MDQRLIGFLLSASFAVALTASASAAEWDQGAGKDWEALLAAAKKEGQVAVIITPGGMVDTLGKAFKQDTGIDVNVVTGTISELNVKFDTEVQTGRVSIDVRLGGPTGVALIRQGLLAPINNKLLLPGVTDPAVWLGGKISWVDAAAMYMPTAAEYVGGRPLINGDLIDAKSITRWDDLLKPEFKGKIAAMDPGDGGIGRTAAEYIAKTKGIDFIGNLYKGQAVTLVTDRRQLVEWAVRGVYPIVIGADAAPEIETFRQAGITSLRVLSLSDGRGALIGGGSTVAVPAKAPHPNAAMVFVNWFMSVRGQEAYVAGQRQPSNRQDVTTVGVQANLIPEPGIEYLNMYGEGFIMNERVALGAAIAKAVGK